MPRTAQILKPGLVHEYANHDATAHCEAHIACLELVDPQAGSLMRAKANAAISKYGSIRHATYELQRECSERLDKAAPVGMYFGAPSARSNMAGFWPSEWIEGATPRNPKGVPESVARVLGSVTIQALAEVETAIVERSPVDCLCQSGHNPT